MPPEEVGFFDMFPCLSGDTVIRSMVGQAAVTGATVDRANAAMRLSVRFTDPVPPVYITQIENAIAPRYGLRRVTIAPSFPAGVPSAGTAKKSSKSEKNPEKKAEKPIFGKITGKVIPMSEVNIDSGRVTVEGEIFSVTSREVRSGAYVLTFDMTDRTGSVRVSRFIRKDDEIKKAAMTITAGMYVTVTGTVGFNRYDGDISIDPMGIAPAKKEARQDKAGQKRVELHLHTQMSAMDALTNTKDVIKRAIQWGHPAIAITDHGVCQSFPDAARAAGDKIKVLYGVEGYYINDVDERVAVNGSVGDSFDDPIVAFDIETTGLNNRVDRIIEIGAVLFRNGEKVDEFKTYVDPNRHIPPEISRLTGITDEMVAGAPGEREAVAEFLRFAGDYPLAAHNASFDIGFLEEACLRQGFDFAPSFVDTLVLAQAMMPDARNHKLDTVAADLGIPSFEHHRASDDAAACGYILMQMVRLLAKQGVRSPRELNGFVSESTGERAKKRKPRLKHISILAANETGKKNLYRIVTKSYLEHMQRNPVIPKSVLTEYREGLIIGSACEAGEVFAAVTDRRCRAEQRRLAEFYDYLEIMPLANNRFMFTEQHPRANNDEELRDFNRRIVELGEETGRLVCATGDVHFMEPEDEIFRHVLLAAKEFADADNVMPLYFRTTDDMLEEFSYLGEEKAFEVVVTNTNKVAELCEVINPLPPAGKLFAPKIENSAQQLKDLVYTKMHDLYGENPPQIVIDRIETELKGIIGQEYDVIYMTAQKLVQNSMEHGYLVGSRGSVGSSLVAFMSGITEVNSLPPHYRCSNCRNTEFITDQGYGCGADMPDKICPKCGTKYSKEGFDIPFETFLGFSGDKVPDIDLNFSGEYQAEAHKYTNELFGSSHVFRAGTIGTVAEKTAFGYVKKYLERTGRTVSKAEENRLALGCVGVKRTTGQHPGGLVVIPQDMEIADFCPAQHPADDPDTDIITTHFEYHCMEDNLLKLDELGHDDPTMIRMLQDTTGIDPLKIPLDDPETLGIFSSPLPLGLAEGDPIVGKTGTLGIPEFGTSFARQMLVDTNPQAFDTLVRLAGLAHGTDVWAGNIHDIVVSGTAPVTDCVCCRDDIMLYLISKGLDPALSFKTMEAVRKGRVKSGGGVFPGNAEEQMHALGVPEWWIESCRKIAYLFPKAHAVAYVMMAFRIAWFKVHYPKEFYGAYFYRRSQKDAFDAAIMTQGAETVRRKFMEISQNPDASAKDEDLLTTLGVCWEFYQRGFEFEPIDLYESDAVKFRLTERGLRPPFVAISGLGESAARDLAAHRRDREFISVEDLTDCCTKVSKSHIEQLRQMGALGDLPETSQLSLF